MKSDDITPAELSLCSCDSHVEIEFFDGMHVIECFNCDEDMYDVSRGGLIKRWNEKMIPIIHDDDFVDKMNQILEENTGIIQRIIDYDKDILHHLF